MAPVAIKILSGGNISEHVSYYTYFLMSEDAKVVGLGGHLPLSFQRPLRHCRSTSSSASIRVTDPIKADRDAADLRELRRLRVPGRRQPHQPGLRPRCHRRHGDEVRDGLHPPGGQRQRHRGAGHLRLGQVQEPRSTAWPRASGRTRSGSASSAIAARRRAKRADQRVTYFGPDLRLRLEGRAPARVRRRRTTQSSSGPSSPP